jgi:hypothetical protein
LQIRIASAAAWFATDRGTMIATADYQRQVMEDAMDAESQFRNQLGAAVLEVWGDLPRDLQEAIFETAVRDAPDQRGELAKLLHERHPRTEHPSGA